MNEGSLRCDVNLSIRKKGSDKLGTRTEMKNLNSFQNVVKAIEYEYARQVSVLEEGGEVIQETRRFDMNTGKTSSMRSKENADDYRYFPDPDLVPIVVSPEFLEEIRAPFRCCRISGSRRIKKSTAFPLWRRRRW